MRRKSGWDGSSHCAFQPVRYRLDKIPQTEWLTITPIYCLMVSVGHMCNYAYQVLCLGFMWLKSRGQPAWARIWRPLGENLLLGSFRWLAEVSSLSGSCRTDVSVSLSAVSQGSFPASRHHPLHWLTVLSIFKASTRASNPSQASNLSDFPFCCISLTFCFLLMLKAPGNTLSPSS